MPHTFPCDLRWADMDLLGHVNNVRYVDYLAAGREAALAGGAAATAPVAAHQVEFLRPLVFRRDPVMVDTWVTGVGEGRLSVAQEVYDVPTDPAADAGREGGRDVYLRASTVLDVSEGIDAEEREGLERLRGEDHTWRELAHPRRPPRSSYDVRVRRADLDQRGLVSDAVLFEYLQESRIRYVMDLHTRGQDWTHHVIARTDVQYLRPMPMRAAPYTVDSWIGHVGTKSFTICAEVRDDDTVLASATVVMVTFDKEAQRPAEMAASQRERLEAELGEPAGDGRG